MNGLKISGDDQDDQGENQKPEIGPQDHALPLLRGFFPRTQQLNRRILRKGIDHRGQQERKDKILSLTP
jgi:hypothetical protein